MRKQSLTVARLVSTNIAEDRYAHKQRPTYHDFRRRLRILNVSSPVVKVTGCRQSRDDCSVSEAKLAANSWIDPRTMRARGMGYRARRASPSWRSRGRSCICLGGRESSLAGPLLPSWPTSSGRCSLRYGSGKSLTSSPYDALLSAVPKRVRPEVVQNPEPANANCAARQPMVY